MTAWVVTAALAWLTAAQGPDSAAVEKPWASLDDVAPATPQRVRPPRAAAPTPEDSPLGRALSGVVGCLVGGAWLCPSGCAIPVAQGCLGAVPCVGPPLGLLWALGAGVVRVAAAGPLVHAAVGALGWRRTPLMPNLLTGVLGGMASSLLLPPAALLMCAAQVYLVALVTSLLVAVTFTSGGVAWFLVAEQREWTYPVILTAAVASYAAWLLVYAWALPVLALAVSGLMLVMLPLPVAVTAVVHGVVSAVPGRARADHEDRHSWDLTSVPAATPAPGPDAPAAPPPTPG